MLCVEGLVGEPQKDELPEEVSSDHIAIYDHIVDTGALNADFAEMEIIKGIVSLKSDKAGGIDKVLNEYIKSTAGIFFTCLC